MLEFGDVNQLELFPRPEFNRILIYPPNTFQAGKWIVTNLLFDDAEKISEFQSMDEAIAFAQKVGQHITVLVSLGDIREGEDFRIIPEAER
jgi:hypothetical protein